MNSNALSDKREIEAKYVIKKADISRIVDCLHELKEDGQLMIAGTRTVSFTDYYYDTPDLLLAFNNCSLRLRERPGHPTKLTFKKSLAETSDGIHNRVEVEGIPTKRLMSEVLSEAPWIAIRHSIPKDTSFDGHVELMHSIGVYNSFRVENTRTIHTVVMSGELYAEVSLDEGAFRKDNIAKKFFEFEIEYLSGNDGKMPQLCDLITSKLGGLNHHRRSKYVRGLKVLDMWKDGKDKGGKRFKRWKKELNKLFKKYEKHYRKTLEFTDPRALHKTRVTIRRITTLLNFLPDFTEESKSGAFIKENLSSILKRLGTIRDYDVLINKTRDGSDDADDLVALIQLKRNEEVLSTIQFLNSLNLKKVRKQWTKFIDKELKELLRQASLEQHYINLKNRLSRSIAEFNESTQMRGVAHPISLRKLHKSRIILKELRYATDFMDILSPGGPEFDTSPYEQLQNKLGYINDRFNEIQFYRQLIDEIGDILNENFTTRTNQLTAEFVQYLERLDLSELTPPGLKLINQPDLTEIKGIGKRTKEILHRAGIRSIDDLAQLEVDNLEREKVISEQMVSRAIREDWIGQARKLAL